MTPEYFDRGGKPISQLTWVLHCKDEAYRLIAKDMHHNVKITTFWSGVACAYDAASRPLIFETAMYSNGITLGLDSIRHYATEDDALKGHQAVLVEARALFEAREGGSP